MKEGQHGFFSTERVLGGILLATGAAFQLHAGIERDISEFTHTLPLSGFSLFGGSVFIATDLYRRRHPIETIQEETPINPQEDSEQPDEPEKELLIF